MIQMYTLDKFGVSPELWTQTFSSKTERQAFTKKYFDMAGARRAKVGKLWEKLNPKNTFSDTDADELCVLRGESGKLE